MNTSSKILPLRRNGPTRLLLDIIADQDQLIDKLTRSLLARCCDCSATTNTEPNAHSQKCRFRKALKE